MFVKIEIDIGWFTGFTLSAQTDNLLFDECKLCICDDVNTVKIKIYLCDIVYCPLVFDKQRSNLCLIFKRIYNYIA